MVSFFKQMQNIEMNVNQSKEHVKKLLSNEIASNKGINLVIDCN